MTIAIYGAGYNFDRFYDYYVGNKCVINDDIAAVVDRDEEKQGTEKKGYKIHSPKYLDGINIDCLVITPNSYKEISEDLGAAYPNLKLMSWREYIEKKNIEYQFKHCDKGKADNWKKFDYSSLVVYTAITNNYDKLKTPLHIIPGAKYICFTDDKTLSSDVWEVRYVDVITNDREFKILPHKYLSDYKTSIWIDASAQITGDLVEYVSKYQKKANVLFFPHQERRCIYDEVAACIYLCKDSKKRLVEQMIKYHQEGYPMDNNLMCGGCIVRNHNEQDVIDTMELWWDEYLSGSRRDQISLPYAFWKMGVSYDLSNENIYKNSYFDIKNHR